jgi:hypothetical protein
MINKKKIISVGVIYNIFGVLGFVLVAFGVLSMSP